MIKIRQYIRRHPGDVISNGAVLLKRIDRRLWKIQCACGNVYVSQPAGNSGHCRECGYKQNSITRTIHGESPDTKKNASRLYGIWLNMKQRCTNPNLDFYHIYGGRGITIDPVWNDYLAFKEWALSHGYTDKLSLDRINVNGNYEPSNCRWATQKEQMRNTRRNHLLTFNGATRTMAEWSEITGISYHTLKQRINKSKWPVEKALTTPVKTLQEKGA